MNIQLLNGDCLDKLKELEENSIDSIVTDPPYGLSFMGKKWDYDVPSTEIWEECMRVLKPGGHLLSFAGSRTYHRMAVRIEDAGFEIRDQIMWIYGSGFPKSHNVGNAIDKKNGAGNRGHAISSGNKFHPTTGEARANGEKLDKYEARTEEGKGWEGWGTALKPAHEPIVLARKPLVGTVANNVLEYGVGGLNIDGCRVIPNENDNYNTLEDKVVDGLEPGVYTNYDQRGDDSKATTKTGYSEYRIVKNDIGRFPANIILDEEAGKILDEQSGITAGGHWPHTKTSGFGEFGGGSNEYFGVGPKDKEKGGASRFFYCPKAQKKDRNEGMPENVETFIQRPRREDGSVIYKETHPEEWSEMMKSKPRKEKTSLAASEEKLQTQTTATKNNHPTVKPTELMKYLIRLVTPKGGVVLDPFMGSGSTGKAAVLEGMNFVGIEREKEYFEIAEQRINHSNKKNKYTEFFD
jgi:site-specific DNA-methyltransferase (adenine-specific)